MELSHAPGETEPLCSDSSLDNKKPRMNIAGIEEAGVGARSRLTHDAIFNGYDFYGTPLVSI